MNFRVGYLIRGLGKQNRVGRLIRHFRKLIAVLYAGGFAFRQS